MWGFYVGKNDYVTAIPYLEQLESKAEFSRTSPFANQFNEKAIMNSQTMQAITYARKVIVIPK